MTATAPFVKLGFLILVSGAIQAADEFVAKKALAEEQPVVLARAELPLSPEAHPKSVQVVIRDGKSLAQLLDCEDEQAAVAQTAAALGVETVNFKQEMLIAVSAGITFSTMRTNEKGSPKLLAGRSGQRSLSNTRGLP